MSKKNQVKNNERKIKNQFGFPETAKEALERWDKGEAVFTIEMGGLGPAYEQCIHIVVFEIIRSADKNELIRLKDSNEGLNNYMDNLIFKNKICNDLGLSGAQAGAAKNLAFRYIVEGYRKTLERKEIQDRRIQVQRHFPQEGQ